MMPGARHQPLKMMVSGAPDKLRLPEDVWRVAVCSVRAPPIYLLTWPAPRLHIFFECLDLSFEEFGQRAGVRPTIPSVSLEPMK